MKYRLIETGRENDDGHIEYRIEYAIGPVDNEHWMEYLSDFFPYGCENEVIELWFKGVIFQKKNDDDRAKVIQEIEA